MGDLWRLRKQETAEDAERDLQTLWVAESTKEAPEFGRAVWKFVRRHLFITFVFKMGWLFFAMLGNAYLLRELVMFFYGNEPLW